MITVDIVTPTKKVVEGVHVPEVKVTTSVGEIQVLPGHTELLAILGTGPLSYTVDGEEKKYAVSYGFVEVRKDKVLILAETCESATEIDRARAQTAQKRAEEALASALSEEDFKKYQLKLQRAIIRQQIAN